jgi:hypothetical protein
MNSLLKDTSQLNLEDIFASKGRCKIIRLLALRNEMNISSIINLTKLNYCAVKSHLNYFKSIDFIQEKIFGRIKIYRYKTENLKANALKNLLNFWESSDEQY